jgi:hypothetical protein
LSPCADPQSSIDVERRKGERYRGKYLCSSRSSRVGMDVKDNLLLDVCTEIRQLVFDLQQYRMQRSASEVVDFDARWGFSASKLKSFERNTKTGMLVNKHQ